MILANAILNACDYDDLQPEDIVDGGEDKQIDILSLEEDSTTGIATLTAIQVKNSVAFSSNALTLLKNGLDWVFEKPQAQYSRLRNIPLVGSVLTCIALQTRF